MEQTGQFGTVDGIDCVRSWSYTPSYANTKQSSSNMANGTNREKGPFDWSGSFSCYGYKPPLSHMPGEYVSLSLYKNPDDSGDSEAGEIVTGTGLINSVVITMDWKTNTPANYVCNFGGHGDIVYSSGAPYADASAPNFYPPCDGYVQRVTTPSPVRITRVTQAVLTISREMKTSINSGSTSGAGKCTTLRYPGSAIDWSLALTRDEGNIDTDMQEGDIVELKVFVDATNFWHLKWGLIKDVSGVVVNRETQDIISHTNNIEMKGANAGVLGLIKAPGDSGNWWPAV